MTVSKALLTSVAALALIGFAVPAEAQRAPSPRPPGSTAFPSSSPFEQDSEVEAQRVMNAYAACLARRFRRGTEAYLSILPGTEEAKKGVFKLVTPDCLGSGQLRFKGSLLRGGLYEALYEADFRRAAPTDFTGLGPLNYTAGRSAPFEEDTAAYLALAGFADCVVRADSAASRELILSKVASKEEGAAFARLMPRLSGCLANGIELKFSRPILRGYIAEALYRLSVAKAAAPANAGNG